MAETTLASTPAAELADDLDKEETSPENLHRFAEQALAAHKQQSLELAVRARWIALAIIAVLLFAVSPWPEVLYYHFLIMCFAAIAWAQRKVGRVGQSRAELFLMACDILLLAIICLIPNPFSAVADWPLPMQFRFENFIYFFVLLAGATLSYSWRTIIAMGTWTTGVWIIGIGIIWWLTPAQPEQREALAQVFGSAELAEIMDPNNILLGSRIQQFVVFLIVAATLAVTVRRAHDLLIGHAAIERERANLARYFSPNVVEELSQNDEPLKQVRTQDIAVVFVDIVGFTRYAAEKTPEQVIKTLREFHSRMEKEVFRHHGTLDKYLGDGLMATFGTPSPTGDDATNALRCVRAMMAAVENWNIQRKAKGEAEIKASFGVHFGPAVLGDVGANRLEFAVIGNTVNIASRLEALTREHGVCAIASRDLLDRVKDEAGATCTALAGIKEKSGQRIRGLSEEITIGVLG